MTKQPITTDQLMQLAQQAVEQARQQRRLTSLTVEIYRLQSLYRVEG